MAETVSTINGFGPYNPLRTANVGLEAFERVALGATYSTSRTNGLNWQSPLSVLGIELIDKYNDHLADTTPHGTSADAVNVLNPATIAVDPFNYFGGTYARLIGLTDFNYEQIERNLPWSDKTNLIATLYDLTELLNKFVLAYNAHCAGHAAFGTGIDAVNDIDTGLAVTIPTPDGVVPSLKYRDGYSKYLVEIERTEPAYIKGRVGLWIKDITVLAQAVIDGYAAHLGTAALIHDAVDTVNVLSVKPITKI